MGHNVFSDDDYTKARRTYNVTQTVNVTRQAERRARDTGKLNEIVDPAINPIRVATIRLDEHMGKQIVTVGMPMDIEASVDTTGSMGGEVDVEMEIFPSLATEIRAALPAGYDPQFCFGIFGDCEDPFVLCRPQFEMEAGKIVNYLKEMAPQRGGAGNNGEDPQYAMFARAYLTDAYTNRIGLKGYHFVVTDEPCHESVREDQIERIFGEKVFENELAGMRGELPSCQQVVKALKEKTHQFVLVVRHGHDVSDATRKWRKLCGRNSVIEIESTRDLPKIIPAIIGLTEGTVDVTDLRERLGRCGTTVLISQLSNIELGAQVKLRHALPHPVPKKGDLFVKKGDLWPIERSAEDDASELEAATASGGITYL